MNNQIIAESNDTIRLENNYYFPADSIKTEFIEESDTHTICPWKGEASYKSLVVDGVTNKDASWFYPQPKYAAKEIAGYFAFWKGVQIEK